MFLSLIVPVYNSEQYLEECLESLIKQNTDDYEIICVNDGSTDHSLEILKKYSDKIVIIDQENKGVCEARNAGMRIAKGEYIWLIDSDDLISKNILYSVKEYLSSKKCDKLDIGLYRINEKFNDKEKNLYDKGLLEANLYSHNVNIYASIIRRDFLQKYDISFHYPNISWGEDSLFMCEINSYNPSMEAYPKVCYIYRVRPNSLGTLNSENRKKKKMDSLLEAIPIFEKFYLESDRNKDIFADKLMSNLWMELFFISSLERNKEHFYLSQLRKQKLFPYRRVKECTLTRSYMTSRRDILGKTFDFLYTHSNTVIGYNFLRMYQVLRRSLRK